MWRWSGSAAVALLLMMSCGQTVGSVTGRETGGTGGRDARTGGRSGAATGGEEPCPDGTEACPCYGNDTCNDDLVCASGVCVDLSSVATGGQPPITNAVIITNATPTNVLVTNLATNAATTNVATSNLPTNAATTNVVTNLATNVVTNVTVTNGMTNVATVNVAVTNVVTNVTTTNTGVTNAAPTNAAPTNAAVTNTTPLASNYIDDGIIHGYCAGFQQVGGTDTECDVEDGLCCPYSLPGTSWDDVAMIDCNVNQPVDGGDASQSTWTPSGVGSVCIEGTGFERIQIQGPEGATNANDRWCASVPAGGGCVAFGEFNTTCWDNSGNYYAGEPLRDVAAVQPSKSDGVDVAVTPISDTMCVTAVYVQ